jgi:hypothetical protein
LVAFTRNVIGRAADFANPYRNNVI